VVVVTHEPPFAASADRLITIVDGRIQPPGGSDGLATAVSAQPAPQLSGA
jgi:hypothetical protein